MNPIFANPRCWRVSESFAGGESLWCQVDATPVEEAAFWITCGLIDSMLPEGGWHSTATKGPH